MYDKRKKMYPNVLHLKSDFQMHVKKSILIAKRRSFCTAKNKDIFNYSIRPVSMRDIEKQCDFFVNNEK